jgi:hypothetical protein
MNRSLRQVLADSHVAAATIALLLVWALDTAVRGLWDPVYHVGILFTAIAIWDIPYLSPSPTTIDRLTLISSCYLFYCSIVSLAAASLLSYWVYRTGPIRLLIAYRTDLIGRNHVQET